LGDARPRELHSNGNGCCRATSRPAPVFGYRLLGAYFQIWPGMNAGELLGFEYRSNGWAQLPIGHRKDSFTADNDTCIYPDRVMVLSTKLKYFEAKGFDTTGIFRDYMLELETAIAQDTGAANLVVCPAPRHGADRLRQHP
jgi:hypothetical protein